MQILVIFTHMMNSSAIYFRKRISALMQWIYFTLQKGTYDAEQRNVKLRSALVGNASKVKQ